MAAEDYTGPSPAQTAGPHYLAIYEQALEDAGLDYDVWNVDETRTAPTTLGVLSHYKAVVWYTGDDLYVREPGQPGGTGVSKLLDDEVLATRDFMNEGGKLLVTGKTALQGAWDQFLFNPLGAPPNPFCASNQTRGNGDADDPPGQEENCVAVSNDFLQYWLGTWLPITVAANTNEAAGLDLVEDDSLGSTAFSLNGADSAQNQDHVASLLTTSSVLSPDEYPQFASDSAIRLSGPPSYDPTSGTQYMWSQQANSAYKRLTRTVDLTGKSSGSLEFNTSYDTEGGYDFVFVEAHTVGQEDWTTLPDVNGHTSNDPSTLVGCAEDNPYWLNENPWLRHYITRTGTGPFACTASGTSGVWNGATGNSAGWQNWKVDLTPYAGKQVEVSIVYVTDPGTQGLGTFVDDTKVTAGSDVSSTDFETDQGGWAVPGAPEGSGANPNDWIRTPSRGFADGPGIATGHSMYWGFGLEGVTGADTRAKLIGDAMRSFGVTP
jgi:hypothetical protein